PSSSSRLSPEPATLPAPPGAAPADKDSPQRHRDTETSSQSFLVIPAKAGIHRSTAPSPARELASPEVRPLPLCLCASVVNLPDSQHRRPRQVPPPQIKIHHRGTETQSHR